MSTVMTQNEFLKNSVDKNRATVLFVSVHCFLRIIRQQIVIYLYTVAKRSLAVEKLVADF